MDWAKHRRRKAAAKCHMRLDLQSLLPRFAIIDTAKENDAKRARELCGGLRAGEIVLFDKAYVDFSHLHEMPQRGVYFVSRAKDNLAYRCVKRLQKKPQEKILRDDLIVLKTPASRQDYPLRLRRVEALVEVKGKEVVMVFLIAPDSIPRSLLRTFNFEIWKLKCLGACPEDLYPTTSQGLRAVCVSFTAAAGASRPFSARSNKPLTCVIFSVTAPTPCAGRYGRALLLYVLMRFQAYLSRWEHSFTRLFTMVRGGGMGSLRCARLTGFLWDSRQTFSNVRCPATGLFTGFWVAFCGTANDLTEDKISF